MSRHTCAWFIVALVLVAPSFLRAAADTQPTVSREEYESLKREVEALRAQSNPTTAPSATAEDVNDLDRQIQELKDQVHRALPGMEHLVIAGDAAVGFVTQRKTNSTFFAGVSPLFLWEPTDRLLFEAAFDVGINTDADSNSSTSFDLTIANASYLVNDYLAVGGGLFVVPFGVYHNHFDPPWINKFLDDPLAFGDGGISPSSEVGIFARGAVPVLSQSKLTYDVYLTNGPQLITKDPDAAGSLNFDDFTDLNNNKAAGGRVGFLPTPNIELGYSLQFSEPNPTKFRDVHAILQAADINWRQEVREIEGMLDFRAEWVWSNVQRATYDPTGALGFGPITFHNYRSGGYVQLCYRPTLVPNKFIRNFELVTRFDALTTPLSAPGGEHERRYTFGVDYWLTPSAVLKVAYEVDEKKKGPGQNALLVQFGIGL